MGALMLLFKMWRTNDHIRCGRTSSLNMSKHQTIINIFLIVKRGGKNQNMTLKKSKK